jgi:hypothetical protein
MIKSGAAVRHRNISSKNVFVFAGPAVLYVRPPTLRPTPNITSDPQQDIAYTGTQHRTYSSLEDANYTWLMSRYIECLGQTDTI